MPFTDPMDKWSWDFGKTVGKFQVENGITTEQMIYLLKIAQESLTDIVKKLKQ